MIYYHKHEVRWSDIDANRHLANSSYVQYCAQTRMAFMTKHKMGVAQLNRWGIGPVILHERYSFFKEVYADQEVIVSLEISGSSEDASIYQFTHKFYLPDGTQVLPSHQESLWHAQYPEYPVIQPQYDPIPGAEPTARLHLTG